MGALGEILGNRTLQTGDIDVGANLFGQRSRVSPADYMRLIGRDFGVEMEQSEAGGGLRAIQLDRARAAYLSRTQGQTFGRTFREQISNPLQRNLNAADYRMSALGAGAVGLAGGALIGGGLDARQCRSDSCGQ